MNSDINIMWIDDTPSFINNTKSNIEEYYIKQGIVLSITTLKELNDFEKILHKELDGFHKYDIYFIDFNLSNNVSGVDIIKSLQKHQILADILFYSSNYNSLRDKIKNVDESFLDGIYISSRDDIEEKACKIIQKVARRLLSPNYIRGFVLNHISEHDYFMIDYINKNYSTGIFTKICDKVLSHIQNNLKRAEELKEKAQKQFKAIYKNYNDIIPHTLLLEICRNIDNENINELLIDDDITKLRNNLAHKVLHLTDNYKCLLYTKHLSHIECNLSCDKCSIQSNNKYVIEDWIKYRNKLVEQSNNLKKYLSNTNEKGNHI